MLGNVAEQRAIAAEDRHQTDTAVMFIRPQLGAGKQRRGIDQIVEVVDDDRAVLFEERIPSGSGAGELAGVGDDVALGALGASRA